MNSLVFAVDFDGTCVTHEYPNIGKDIGAIPVLKRIISNGHKIILNTMRDKEKLSDAIHWFTENNIPLYGVNENPSQFSWTSSRKVYANFIIDDTALGCPLKYVDEERPYINWKLIEWMLEDKGII